MDMAVMIKDQVFDAEKAGVSEYEPVTVLSRTSKGAKVPIYLIFYLSIFQVNMNL